MSRRLARLGVRLHPDKAAFRVHDRGADPAGLQAPAPPQNGELVSVGYDQMWVASLQDDVEVTVLLEEWDGEPPSGRGAWEQESSGEIYLRGAVAVSTATAEPVVHGVRLLGGVGRYRMRIRAQHRAAIAGLYDALLDRFRDGFSLEFQAALRELQGVEHYLIQLWPSPTASGPQRVVSEAALALSGAFPPAAGLEPPDQTGPLPSLPARPPSPPGPAALPPAAGPLPSPAVPQETPQESPRDAPGVGSSAEQAVNGPPAEPPRPVAPSAEPQTPAASASAAPAGEAGAAEGEPPGR
ncbi:hypothetical protein SAMN04489712_114112 [Thermomonospora echinospora]|uniref:Uncharacterized protein n=1 Tax=Thermomonospora echinospora TaxID=1992 RepID=A0A1H6DAD4_9ACTN|nr:hypothetical protein [Thermomonospora echinospora]SEG81665.1 hypothetical protein SAMN04489712_114112 [Thermomonospora echinospora]